MSGSAGDNLKPRVLVLGGCGFIGRNLVEYLISNDLVSGVRVVDKTPPQLAFLNATHKKIFEDPRVEFKSANLINPESCAAACAAGAGAGAGAGGWALAVNCAAETRPGLPAAVYEEGIVALSGNVARQCAAAGTHLVEISSGYMFTADKLNEEDDPVEPWTTEARMKSRVEAELLRLQETSGLRCTVLRPAIVYGVGDRRGLTPWLLYGAIYKHLGETMKLLWTADVKRSTVHVSDVCRAAWGLGARGRTGLYHVADAADSSQGSLAALVADLFGVSVDYYGAALSSLAKGELAAVAAAADDKHCAAWAALVAARGGALSPLEPRVPPELLRGHHARLHAGRLAAAGLPPAVPRPTPALLRQVLEDYAEMNLFPKGLLE